jgi:hypothetical protein
MAEENSEERQAQHEEQIQVIIFFPKIRFSSKSLRMNMFEGNVLYIYIYSFDIPQKVATTVCSI